MTLLRIKADILALPEIPQNSVNLRNFTKIGVVMV